MMISAILSVFEKNLPAISAHLGESWPQLRNQLLDRVSAISEDSDDSPELAAQIDSLAMFLYETMSSDIVLSLKLTGPVITGLTSSGAGKNSAPSENAVANQYPALRKQIVELAGKLKADPNSAKSRPAHD